VIQIHITWLGCPKTVAAARARQSSLWHKKDSTIILEVVAANKTWIWHDFFWKPGSCNDINVLQRSLLFSKLANGESIPVEFKANDHTYNIGYSLADDIYQKWSTFCEATL
jgi:hypothetical protein